jgi:hypothetical protein
MAYPATTRNFPHPQDSQNAVRRGLLPTSGYFGCASEKPKRGHVRDCGAGALRRNGSHKADPNSNPTMPKQTDAGRRGAVNPINQTHPTSRRGRGGCMVAPILPGLREVQRCLNAPQHSQEAFKNASTGSFVSSASLSASRSDALLEPFRMRKIVERLTPTRAARSRSVIRPSVMN